MTASKGAQPGNINALKHGFYTRRFRKIDIHDLDLINFSIESEIKGLRVAARRILEYTEEIEEPMEAIKALALYGRQVDIIAKLLTKYAILNGQADDSTSRMAINAILEIAQGWKE